ncbi:sigma-54-dependent Fis family transcriptional regulator [Amycolatopsis sp. H20-H5]|uniref:sigma-54-dependent Fis family transcriptional regulator n=1 Tax=Amycolatopsis sp. H20-H5 TaxID=3046309 RepID=UPI002DBBA064|nr:GAF domain-containing protein [Amycolatopsis sp. H20-H5]MEC3976020.1 GAF domain-containing protein [Amycolatopsis sp. H20-H5]
MHDSRLVAPEDQGRLADARIRFLTSEPFDRHDVRDTILASWWRSHRWKVAADHIALPYVRNPNLDLPLIRSANPILRRLSEQLDGQSISLILTDQSGVVLQRLTGDGELDRHLDSIQLAPGFSYAEEFVGTNGIGTALEGGRAAHVFGHEHYAEYLDNLACAGVPIHHPITGKTVGAVDLTCWRKDASPLLVALAKTTADQIRQALLVDSGVRELELFQAYLQACRRTTGMVLALNNDLVIMNDLARQLLDPADQPVILGFAAEALASGRAVPMMLDLPTGGTARVSCRPVQSNDHISGGIVHITLIEQDEEEVAASWPVLRMFLPGLVGSGPLWLRCCHDVDRAYLAGEWLLLGGEPGVGKLALARAIHQRRNAAGGFHVLDAADAAGSAEADWMTALRAELDESREHAVVIRHIDRLEAGALRLLAGALTEASARPGGHPWVAVTQGQADFVSTELAAVRELFPTTVEIPPLRHHIEDLRELVPLFLARLSHSGELMCSHEALQLLTRSNWPGNAEQLHQVLRHVVRHRRRTGAIQPGDLPPEYHAVNRRQLSQLESLERDAIVQSLLGSRGNRVRAAESLGMSRATIYRKIREYGIVSPRA